MGNPPMNNSIVAAVLLLGLGAGYGLAQWQPGASSMPAKADRQALYWYDPMFPQQQFDKPGKSPFMDMQLVPRYADGAASAATPAATPAVQIDPGLAQNIGVRLASVSRGVLTSRLELSGILAFNERDVAVVQARAAGFVERVYARAPGDVLKAGAPLVDLLIPEWAAAQEEFLALRRSGERGLIDAARQRLRLSGMPAGLIAQMERSGQVQSVLTVTSPISGALQTLEVREGMTVTPGQTLARFNGLDQVWLQVAVPEAQGAMLNVGQRVQSHFVGLPGKTLDGTVSAILPATAMDSRTVQVRVELPNPDGALRPGMTAQVSLAQTGGQALLQVPSEALIRTGKRVLVMLAEEGGHYRPVEVETGVENQDHTVILSGLQEGQQVVASGQFLLDSEASLKGVTATAAEAAMNMQPGAQP
ncbi:efflux RND transporter periplasmic adaptor subunit [Pseudomonas sp. FW305-3-2-15-A-LB2]|nr:efflux RND transporter periplasmic adaptor subunit [Pseudomonas sp. FW305-3-2-15-C-TSA2]PMV22951.1 efflux RND transporter periplasmic adaptor subunit [Pseudomonas sp. DP16D-L5]PMV36459.1 efflux RND transporter periplasmic adaptor subunit [Pseudomonas sp. FW305-3-2-15-A-LB2]PMV48524.1 efflux RND transporter periplasmic adaptor subunit [Pseudomonas sp. FW305-3-2-15-C-LB1]PMV50946.1 efflux RND transporter periplasmic adaptor subunit [Pseudomonas sp. GW460-4]PMV60139.1 efflux RND transporter pe